MSIDMSKGTSHITCEDTIKSFTLCNLTNSKYCDLCAYYKMEDCYKLLASDVAAILDNKNSYIYALQQQVQKLTDTNKQLRTTQKQLNTNIRNLETEVKAQYNKAKSEILTTMANSITSCNWCTEEHKQVGAKAFADALIADMCKSSTIPESTIEYVRNYVTTHFSKE